ncbi:hypothetical protein OIU77_006564 [Salix suchowensis]|uniref:Uncharacterized protein n=1 Tax=Salix suchowensis TaxID=1278906 RepID=A0ABQ9AL41_9ROSI|nr:hypothetical protein OIU77_006564 [Salix suchowensis]
MQLSGLYVVVFLKCFLVVFGQQIHSQHKVPDLHWKPATATWYGSPEGDGSDGECSLYVPGIVFPICDFGAAFFFILDLFFSVFMVVKLGDLTHFSPRPLAWYKLMGKEGACGYGSLVDVKPLRARVGAVSPVLFKNGEGCGACYKPFGRMAISGENGLLRNRGILPVIYRRTPCKYPGKNIAFHVNEGSTDYWLSLLVEFEDGDGDVGSMHIREAGGTEWLEMTHVWGANWCIVRGPLKGPFSVKLTTLATGRTLSAREVIPRNWAPKATYTSRLNFLH